MNLSRSHLLTEQPNPASHNLDQMSTLALVDLFAREDQRVVEALAEAREQVAAAIELTAARLDKGGRLFYVGAGTSGRLGVLDASECPPTFCTPPDLIQGIIAGGPPALVRSSEGLEDDPTAGALAIAQGGVTRQDVVMGIAAGGTTPYVHGALGAAREQEAATIFLACVPPSAVAVAVDVDIRVLVGPEILAGSTRLKAGTATKMVLNTLSTAVMVRLGKVYGNRMVDMAVSNQKLHDRALKILQDLTGLDRESSRRLLEASGGSVKTALLMQAAGVSRCVAEGLLRQHQGKLRAALLSCSASLASG